MISIIIPTYNSAKTINRCLDSIVAQTYKDYEVLVMDGCSTDETIKIVKAYNDERIQISSEPDKGIYDAMNKGIKRAKGDWLYFLGSDDYLYAPDVLEKVAWELTSEYKIVYGEVEASQLPKECRGIWLPELIEYNRCHQAMFYHKNVFKKFGLYDISYEVYADYVYNLHCFWKYKVPTKYINVIVAHFSEGGISTNGNDSKLDKNIDLLILKYGGHYFPINRRKELAYSVMRNNNDKALHFAMRMYLYYLRILAKLSSCFYNK